MFPLNSEEQSYLLRLAREAIRLAVVEGVKLGIGRTPGTTPVSERVQEPSSAFVTLHERGRLRGCIGYVQRLKPLHETVVDCAISAALQDPRFHPLRPEEMDDLHIEISVLSPFFEIRPEEVEVGKHGLMISRGAQRGLLLPQVATELNWTREKFLEETCVKAGMERDAWQRGAKLEGFTAFVFAEPQPGEGHHG